MQRWYLFKQWEYLSWRTHQTLGVLSTVIKICLYNGVLSGKCFLSSRKFLSCNTYVATGQIRVNGRVAQPYGKVERMERRKTG